MRKSIGGTLDYAKLMQPVEELDIAERIAVLHAQGLKPRDISAMLNVHPQIVMRALGLCERSGIPSKYCTCVGPHEVPQ